MKTYQQFLTEAQKRISQYTVYHGRSVEGAKRARQSGQFREPRSGGASGPGIYGSTNKNVARTYSRASKTTPDQGDMGIVQMRVPKKDVITTEPGFKGRSQSFDMIKQNPDTKAIRIPNTATPDELKRPKKFLTGIGKRDERGDHFVMNPQYASSKIVKNPPPIIKKNK
jgi:hypothetical protein